MRVLDTALYHSRKSKESVNRTLDCAAALLIVTLVAAPARGQVAAGRRGRCGISVGHRSRERSSAAGPPTASRSTRRPTPPGTFVLHGQGVGQLLVTCRYCEPASSGAAPAEPVVVIVRRYQALASDAPSADDLENLPYSHVESAIALRPFTLLAQSSDAVSRVPPERSRALPERFAARSTTGRRTTTSSTVCRRTLSYRPTTSGARSCSDASNAFRLRRPGRRRNRRAHAVRAGLEGRRSPRSGAMRSRARRSDPTPSGIVARIVYQQ